jgi:predicted nucleotidyltransferase/DNA-binding XRE family transcriptional regulator
MENSIKNLRKQKGLTQQEASKLSGVPLRTFKNYENDSSKVGTIKYNHIIETLEQYGYIDEEHGVLTLENIQRIVTSILQQYDVDYCYLFGSYARSEAREDSDVDLLVSTSVTGLAFFGLIEKLREALHKKVDLLTLPTLHDNDELVKDILKEGVKIYEKRKE